MSELERAKKMMAEITHDYISRADCGCVVAICADMKNPFTAKFVSDEIRAGHEIERMPLAEAVAALKGDRCPQHRAELERRRAAIAQQGAQGSLFAEEVRSDA